MKKSIGPAERFALNKDVERLKRAYNLITGEPFVSVLSARISCIKTVTESWGHPASRAMNSAAVQSPLIDAISEIESALLSGSISDAQTESIREKIGLVKSWAQSQNAQKTIEDGAMRRSASEQASIDSFADALKRPLAIRRGNFDDIAKFQAGSGAKKD